MDTQTKENIPVTTSGTKVAKPTWTSLHPLMSMERAFDRFFGRTLPSLWSETPAVDTLFEFDGLRMPSLDLIDRDNEILVRAEIPGIQKENIAVSLADNVLTIKGESSSERSEEKGDYYRHEISSSSFARSVSIPSDVNESKVNASLKDGILEVTLPKSDSSKRKTIKIK